MSGPFRHRAPTAILVVLIGLALAVPHGAALHCNGGVITLGTGPTILYVDDRSAEAGPINHWFYLESNGREGLQSGDDDLCLDCGPFAFTDPCQHPDPDQLIL